MAGSYVFREPGKMVEMSGQRVDELAVQLMRGLESGWRYRKQYAEGLLGRWSALRPERRLREFSLRVQAALDRLRAMGPEETLKRGYALVQSLDGKLIRGVAAAKKQSELVVRFSDGKIAGNYSSWCQDLGRSGSVKPKYQSSIGLLLEQDGWETPFGSVEGIVRCAFAHF